MSTRLGVLAIMKNEELNVREWLDHYFWLGVDQVYLIDNGSNDASVEIARQYPERDRIDLVIRPERHQQGAHYRAVYDDLRIAERSDWLMMADLDEFWFRKDGGSIREHLDQHPEVDLFYTNWTVFGSTGFDRHPTSVRRDLVMRRPKLADHAKTKWICRTSALKADQIYTHKLKGVDSRKVVSDNVDLQLNHYPTPSREFWEIKMQRGDASNPNSDSMRTWEYFHRFDAACTVADTRLSDLVLTAEQQVEA